MCGYDRLHTCVYNYPTGFRYPNPVINTNFVWIPGKGNVGPVGVAEECNKAESGVFGGASYPSCSVGWVAVDYSPGDAGTECGSETQA